MSESIPSLVVTSDVLGSTTTTNTSQDVSNANQTLGDMQSIETQNALMNFWQKQLSEVENMTNNDFKDQFLPLARIKKIMKMDEDVKMISAEAPLLFAKAAQMFITELSLRAWVHTEENKRRTLQRNDIATAITKFDQFDFLIDIVPREDIKPSRRTNEETKGSGDNIQYFYNLPPQPTQNNPTTQSTTQSPSSQSNQVVITPSGQILQLNAGGQPSNGEATPHIIQLSQPQAAAQSQQQSDNNTNAMIISNQQSNSGVVVNPSTESQSAVTPQLIQQLISSSGSSPSDIHSIQITPDGQIQIIKAPSNTSENL